MFGFSFRSLAEAAISSLSGTKKNDEELEKMLQEVKTQESGFPNIISITKEVEKQLHNLAETNSNILCHMEALEGEMQKKDISVDIWGNASRFYYTIGEVKDNMIPNIKEKVFSIRSEISRYSETIKDIEEKISIYNRKEHAVVDDEEKLKQLEFNEQSLANYKDSNEEMISELHTQVMTLTESIASSKEAQVKERESLTSALTDLKNSIHSFVELSLSSLYQTFSSIYTTLSQSFVNEVPQSILSLKQPLFDNQVDEELKVIIPAGSTEEYSISMNRGGVTKWLFNCNDSNVTFCVYFTSNETKEMVCVEEEYRVKGDGRYDTGDFTCEEPGVLTLIWNNSFSVLTSREVYLRLSVLQGKEELVSEKNEQIEEPVQQTEELEHVQPEQSVTELNPTEIKGEAVVVSEPEPVEEFEAPEELMEMNEKWEDIDVPEDVKLEMEKFSVC